MEWDQIADKWAQMADRLCRDRPARQHTQAQRKISAAPDGPRAPAKAATTAPASAPARPAPDKAGDHPGLTQHR